MSASKHGQQRENGKKITKNEKSVKMRLFLKQTPQFSALDERDCKAAWGFDHWGPFGRQRRARPHGADSPHVHMHRGKIGQFFEVWGFPAANVGLCVDGPYNTAGDLQNTPGTPAMHFQLAASSSQSAL